MEVRHHPYCAQTSPLLSRSRQKQQTNVRNGSLFLPTSCLNLFTTKTALLDTTLDYSAVFGNPPKLFVCLSGSCMLTQDLYFWAVPPRFPQGANLMNRIALYLPRFIIPSPVLPFFFKTGAWTKPANQLAQKEQNWHKLHLFFISHSRYLAGVRFGMPDTHPHTHAHNTYFTFNAARGVLKHSKKGNGATY